MQKHSIINYLNFTFKSDEAEYKNLESMALFDEKVPGTFSVKTHPLFVVIVALLFHFRPISLTIISSLISLIFFYSYHQNCMLFTPLFCVYSYSFFYIYGPVLFISLF